MACRIFDALVASSMDDPYLKPFADDGRHCHGYGFAAALKSGSGWKVLHERFDAEPFLSGENACRQNLSALQESVNKLKGLTAGVDKALVMLHSRRTRGEPRGCSGAHPFREDALLKYGGETRRAEIYLCHNGGVDKHKLASWLNIKYPNLYTDSHIYLKYLTTMVSEVNYDELPRKVASAISASREAVKSALDLGVMVMSPGLEPLLMASGYVVDRGDEVRWRYYEPVIVVGEGLTGYVSSTIRDLVREKVGGVEFRDGFNGLVWELSLPEPVELPIPTHVESSEQP